MGWRTSPNCCPTFFASGMSVGSLAGSDPKSSGGVGSGRRIEARDSRVEGRDSQAEAVGQSAFLASAILVSALNATAASAARVGCPGNWGIRGDRTSANAFSLLTPPVTPPVTVTVTANFPIPNLSCLARWPVRGSFSRSIPPQITHKPRTPSHSLTQRPSSTSTREKKEK